MKEKKPKKPRKPINGYIKVGPSFDLCHWKETSSSFGYEVALGLKQPISHQGAYWGIEAGGMSNRYLTYRYDWESSISLFGVPYIGWNFESKENLSLAPYFGPFVCYGTNNLSNANWRAGLSFGTNLWINNQFAIGLNYKVDLLDDTRGVLHKITLGISYSF